MPMKLKRTEIVFAMWVVVLGQVIELANPLDQRLHGDFQSLQQVNHPSGQELSPWYAGIAFPESIVQWGYPLYCGRYHETHN